MPDALPLPDDLIDLRRAANNAHAQVVAYGHEADAELRAQYADEETQVEHRFLTPEQAATLIRLRAEESEIRAQIRSHPTMVEALAAGCHWPTEKALQEAAAKELATS